ncbi:MAG: MFS transporter [Bacillota bacterium]
MVRKRRFTTLLLFVIILVSFLDNFAQLPLIAPFARYLGATPFLTGVLVAVYSFTNMLGNLLSGFFLDSFGRKAPVFGGLLVAGFSVFLYSLVSSPKALILVRALHGLGGAILVPAVFTLAGDHFPHEKRGQQMGFIGATIAFAAIVAPPLSGMIRDSYGFGAVFRAVSVLFVVTALVSSAFLEETYVRTGKSRYFPLLAMLNRQDLRPIYASSFVLTLTLGTITYYLPVLLESAGYGSSTTGMAFGIFALSAALTMAGPPGKYFADRRFSAIALGLVLVAGSMLVLPFSISLAVLGTCMWVYGAGFGLMFPAMNSEIADKTKKSERGTAFSVFYAFYSLGVVVGPTVGGLIVSTGLVQYISPFHWSALACFAGLLFFSPLRAS